MIFRRRYFGIPDGDLALSAALIALAVLESFGSPTGFGRPFDALGSGVAALGAAAVAMRGRWPRSTALVACAGFAILMWSGRLSLAADTAAAVAIYTCTVGRYRWTALGGVTVITGAAALWSYSPMSDIERLGFTLSWLAAFSAIAVAGDMVRARRALAAARAERDAERAVAQERTRLAQELHDVVGHTITGMTVQAATGLHLLGPDGPPAAREALSAIHADGSSAMRELRAGIAALNESGAEPATRSLRELPALLASVGAAGLPVSLTGESDVELSPQADHAAYRTIQEALTNVLRHAGPTATAEVELRREADHLSVRVTNTGTAGDYTPGSGLNGMRQRIGAVGGSVEFGPDPHGFTVLATLPIEESQ